MFLTNHSFILLLSHLHSLGKPVPCCPSLSCFDTLHPVPLDRVFIFTPHSSREWILQTRQRFPSVLHDNIGHRNNIKQIVSRIRNKRNVLLILDEVQIAFQIGQSTFNLFHQLGFYQPNNLFLNDIKIVSFTATPTQLPQDFLAWKQYATIQKMDVPESYISHKTLLHQNRLFQMKDLTCFDNVTQSVRSEAYDNIREILPFVLNMDSPKFHIIRTPRAKLHHVTIRNFQHVFKTHNFNARLISEADVMTSSIHFLALYYTHSFSSKTNYAVLKLCTNSISAFFTNDLFKNPFPIPLFRDSRDVLPAITTTRNPSFSHIYLPFIIIIPLLTTTPYSKLNANLLLSSLFKVNISLHS